MNRCNAHRTSRKPINRFILQNPNKPPADCRGGRHRGPRRHGHSRPGRRRHSWRDLRRLLESSQGAGDFICFGILPQSLEVSEWSLGDPALQRNSKRMRGLSTLPSRGIHMFCTFPLHALYGIGFRWCMHACMCTHGLRKDSNGL